MLDPIASVTDAEDFGYSVSETDLLRASSRVRTYTGQQVTAGESTVLLGGVGPWRLPQRPVVSVESLVDSDGNPVAFELRGSMLHACGRNLTVSFTHGWAAEDVPDGITEAVCQIATRLASSDPRAAAMQQVSQGAVQVTFGLASANAASDLMPGEKAILDRLFPRLPRTIGLL